LISFGISPEDIFIKKRVRYKVIPIGINTKTPVIK